MAIRTTAPASGRPAGGGRNLRTLGPAECFSLLETGGVGRVGFMSATGIVMLPVNFTVVRKTVIFRTGPDTVLAAYGNAPVSFQADHLDPEKHEGWSVLIQGHAHKVSGEQEVAKLEQSTGLEPWAAGARDVWVRITPTQITGRSVEGSRL